MWARAVRIALVVGGSALTTGVMLAAFDHRDDALMPTGFLLVGPIWCHALALASDEDDFADAPRTRSQWLGVLPWTYVLAPLVVPNLVLLVSFFRDARADGGRSVLSWDRMRPGESAHDHHWPD